MGLSQPRQVLANLFSLANKPLRISRVRLDYGWMQVLDSGNLYLDAATGEWDIPEDTTSSQ